MGEAFTANPVSLSHLLSCIEARKLALPDFQRDYVWHPAQVSDLLCSLEREYPAGSILVIKCGKGGVFAERPFEGAPSLDSARPDELVLDGQQRLTSLYGALYGKHPTHRFYVHVRELLDGKPLEEALFYESVASTKETDRLAFQQQEWVFPLHRLFVGDGYLTWAAEVAPQEMGKHIIAARSFAKMKDYRFPVVTLSEDTSPEAVCRIFTTINSSGTRLTIFDLLAARLWSAKVRLRDLLNESLEGDPTLNEYLDGDPVPLLQAIALLAGKPVTQSSLLALTADEVSQLWETAATGFGAAVRMLRDECGVLRPKYVPYGPALVPMASCWRLVAGAKGPEKGRLRGLLKRWFWCTSFGGRYEASANTRIHQDYKQLDAWLQGGPEPVVVSAFDFRPADLRETNRSSAGLYRAVLALMLQRGALDFHKRSLLTPEVLASLGVDDHHVFPQKSEIGNSVPRHLINSILNRVLIDPETNKRISNRAPSDYLKEISAAWSANGALEQVLDSHLLPGAEDGPLRTDDFARFLEWRQDQFAAEVEKLTGWAREGQLVAQQRISALARALRGAAFKPVEDSNPSEGYWGFGVKLPRHSYLWFGIWNRAREWSPADRVWLHWESTSNPSVEVQAAWAALRDVVGGGAEFNQDGSRVIPVRIEASDTAASEALQRFLGALA